MAEPRYRCTACGRRGISIFFPERDGRQTCRCGSTGVVLDGDIPIVEANNSALPARRTTSFEPLRSSGGYLPPPPFVAPAATTRSPDPRRRRPNSRAVWTLVFFVSATVGAILAAAGNHIEDEHGGWLNGGSPPGSGLVGAGAVVLLIAAAIAAVWLYRVVERHVFRPVLQELQIALGPLPPVEALRHPDGTPLSAEEQAVAGWQLAQRQAQARQHIALLGLVLWFGHRHVGDGHHGN